MPETIYGVYDMNVESASGRATLLGLYATEAGALAAISENLKTPAYTREPFGDYIHNFTFEAVKELQLNP